MQLEKSEPYENINKRLLWKNPEGVIIDLNDPVDFQKELDAERLRYRLSLQNKFLAETEIYKGTQVAAQMNYSTLMQKLKNRAERKGTSLATELNFTIYKHMEAYKGKLKKIKTRLDTDSAAAKYADKVWWHKTTAYDMSTEEGAIAYINRMAVNHIGGKHTPERLKLKLLQLKQEVLPKLENIGYIEIADKLGIYIKDLINTLDYGTVPDALRLNSKRPALIKQVRGKDYDISDKYAFGTYLSFSYCDMLKQNPNMSEDEARTVLCNKVIVELQNDPTNPTTTTALKQLEDIINSPTKFYNFIHAKRLANKKSAEKRKLKRQNNFV